MATYTLTAADALLKDFYLSPIIEQLNYKTYMLDQIERDSTHVEPTGRRWIFPVHVRGNRGRGSRGDNANLPIAGYNVDVDAIDKMKYHYYAMEISDPTIEASKSDAGAYANLLTRETKSLAKEMRKDMNRQIYGAGTGVLSAVAKNSETTKVYVTSVQYMSVGDPVDVLVTSTGATTNGVVGAVITKRVSGSEPYIEIDTSLAGVAGTTYSVYISGSRSNEIPGLRNMIGTKERELHGINSATAGNEYWDPKIVKAESNTAGESLFEKLYDEVGAGGNGEVDVFITTRGILRRLADTYQSQKRFNDAQATTIHGGYTGVFVNNIPVIADDDAPKGYIFGINKDSFRWFEQAGPGWLEKDGQIFHLKNASTAGQKMNVWQAWFRWYATFGTVAPNRNGVITEAADDTAA